MRTTTINTLLRRSTLSVLVAAASQGVLAQTTSNGFALEEVIVTAQKRAENLQDVAISAQAFSADEIRVLGVDTVSDLIFAAPSLNAGSLGGSQQQMGIRGVVDFSRNPGVDPRMGIYIDEIYQGQGYSADQPLLGLETVEILRGPQGTLFGKNTVSGAINLVTKDPTEVTEGEIAATYGNEGQAKVQAYVSGGLTSNLFGSLALTYDERDGLYTNTFLNEETGDFDRVSARGKLRWVPTDDWDISLSYDYSKRESTEPVGTEASLPAFEYRGNVESNDRVEFWGVGLEANYTLPSGYQIVSISSYRDSEFELIGDDDMTPIDIQLTEFDEYNDQITQEIRFQSPEDQDFTWLVGLYYYDSERSTNRRATFGPALLAGTPFEPFAPAIVGYTTTPITVDHTSYAAFFHSDWAVTDALSLTFGIRYTEDDKKVDWAQQSYPNDPATAAFLEGLTGIPLTQSPGALFGAFNAERKQSRSENDVAPMLSINYQFSDNTMVYGRYARAAKSGGFNAEFVLNGFDYFEYDQETVDSFELGLKTTAFDDTLRVNLAAFEMQFDDYQVFQFLDREGASPSLELTNAGEVSVTGLETEITWVPVQNFRLLANATFLDAAYDKFDNPGGGEAFTGNQLPYAPDLKYYLAAQYMMEFAGGNITFDVDYTYVDDQFTDPGNLAIDAIDDYSLIGARVAYTPASEAWELALWGRNLGDEEFNRLNNDNFLGTPRTLWGDPRLYGLTFSYFFGG